VPRSGAAAALGGGVDAAASCRSGPEHACSPVTPQGAGAPPPGGDGPQPPDPCAVRTRHLPQPAAPPDTSRPGPAGPGLHRVGSGGHRPEFTGE
jgi:hypothetical protein